MKYNIHINGLRHHDFAKRLDELYERAPGRRMSISIEHDNPSETNAVIVYFGKYMVGYVRSRERELAYSLIKASGREVMMGTIVAVDREKKWLEMELTSERPPAPCTESTPKPLAGWHYDGQLLPCDEPEQRLYTMLSLLEMNAETLTPWDEDAEEWLEYIEKNLWRDFSRETYHQTTRILDLLTKGGKQIAEYRQKADRVQLAIDAMGSPETRRLQTIQILDLAKTENLTLLRQSYGDRAAECCKALPEALVALFREDGEKLMARLWYLHLPRKQTRAIKTLLALLVRLETEKDPRASIVLTEQWLLNWAAQQKDKTKADVVKEIISAFEMEKSNPQLAMQMQKMTEECCAPKPTQINQLNMGNGTQQLPPDVNLPKLPTL